MVSTNELRDALGQYGAARLQLQSVWGKWADEFCDDLLLRLPILPDKCKIHLWGQQLNIDVGNTGGYTVDYDADPLRVIGERLNEELVRGSDTGQKRT